MELIGRVSKGSVMDQIYLPKQRPGMPVGSYVLIKPALQASLLQKPVLYGIRKIEPLKIEITKRIFALIEEKINCENIIITGSFVKQGFRFKDIDILIVTNEKKVKDKELAAFIGQDIGVKLHILILTGKELSLGIARDPLYAMMLSRCIAKKRFTYHLQERIIKPQLLDLHLLKSKLVFYNLDHISGDDLYYLIRNMVAVTLFLKGKVSIEQVENKIKHIFGVSEEKIRRKELEKRMFLRKYKEFYDATFKSILKYAHDAKQKQAA